MSHKRSRYAGQRLAKLLPKRLSFLADVRPFSLARTAQWAGLKLALLFYKFGKVLLAPNEEPGAMLESNLNRSFLMMRRGVGTNLFSLPNAREKKGFHHWLRRRANAGKERAIAGEIGKGVLEAGAKDFTLRDWRHGE